MVSRNDLSQRISKIQSLLKNFENSILLVTPGPNLRYLTDYKAKNLERLTCLVMTSDQKPVLIVPELEKLAAMDAGLNEETVDLRTWGEGKNPFELFSKFSYKNVFIDEKMTADKVLNFQKTFQGSKFTNAALILNSIRSVKSDYEIDQLKSVGKMIDVVHTKVPEIIKPGLTEIEVAKIIGNKILESGHDSVDFVIVASGHNSASPHHEPSNKVIEKGEVVVVDIGGTSPSGYCSDSTRTYCVGKPQNDFLDYYSVLRSAQEAACQASGQDLSGAQLDSVAREILENNGLGKFFTHRTGHGIGMETHEEPYVVTTNKSKLVAGNAFSVEPGFYIENRFGARIEDIVVKLENGFVRCNETTRELVEI